MNVMPTTRASRKRKPRIAFFSPLPPLKTGIADYAASLLAELRAHYEIDLYHDASYVPEMTLAVDGFWSADARLFSRYAPHRDYHAILYQMGNSDYHSFLFPYMMRYPGIVTLHDFCVAGFHLVYGRQIGQNEEYLRSELHTWHPETQHVDLNAVFGKAVDWDVIGRVCVERGWTLNGRIFDRSKCVIVHSPSSREQVRESSSEYEHKVSVIPMGARTSTASAERCAEIRASFGIQHNALVLGAFGFIQAEKMAVEALNAFQEVARQNDHAHFLFVGEEQDAGRTRKHARALGLLNRVRFLGRQPKQAFDDLALVTDVGVNLRRPPTHGETSAALLHLLAAGVATIVTDVGTFSDFPDEIVRKVHWDSDGLANLKRAMHSLCFDRVDRENLGRRAREYVAERHSWESVAKSYADVIEKSRTEHVAVERSRSSLGATTLKS